MAAFFLLLASSFSIFFFLLFVDPAPGTGTNMALMVRESKEKVYRCKWNALRCTETVEQGHIHYYSIIHTILAFLILLSYLSISC